MAKSERTFGKRETVIIILILIVIFLSAAVVAFYDTTLINPLIPALASVALGLSTALWLWKIWRPITGSQKMAWNFICHTIFFSILMGGLFYICNLAFADKSEINETQVEIVGKYHKVRHHMRRISRNRYARGEAYNTYHLKVRFDNSTTRELTLPLGKYRHYQIGDSLNLPIAKGALGAPIILQSQI